MSLRGNYPFTEQSDFFGIDIYRSQKEAFCKYLHLETVDILGKSAFVILFGSCVYAATTKIIVNVSLINICVLTSVIKADVFIQKNYNTICACMSEHQGYTSTFYCTNIF